MRQTDLFLQTEQTRSPDQALAKLDPHIKHMRCLDTPAKLASGSGLRWFWRDGAGMLSVSVIQCLYGGRAIRRRPYWRCDAVRSTSAHATANNPSGCFAAGTVAQPAFITKSRRS
jgi:hypothetical protein